MTAFANVDWAEIVLATRDTLAMLFGSLALTIAVGLPLGVALFLTGPGQVWASRLGNGALALIVNLLRSVPFIILLIVMIPLTVALVGTSLGVVGAILPLVVGAAPFYARLVEGALREVDRTTIEAACRRAGIDPVKSGWSAPRPRTAVAAFRPTPELVHGVAVDSPYAAAFLRRLGAFSGHPLREQVLRDLQEG